MVGAAARDCCSAVPSILSVVAPPVARPSPGGLTRDTKLDDNVCCQPVHAGERERCHRAPHREGAREGVIDHFPRQVFRVVLDPGGEKPESAGAGRGRGVQGSPVRGGGAAATPCSSVFQVLRCSRAFRDLSYWDTLCSACRRCKLASSLAQTPAPSPAPHQYVMLWWCHLRSPSKVWNLPKSGTPQRGARMASSVLLSSSPVWGRDSCF